MMEGLLSACYHVCPNYTNFQFGEATCELLPLISEMMNLFFGIYINRKHPDVFEHLNVQVV